MSDTKEWPKKRTVVFERLMNPRNVKELQLSEEATVIFNHSPKVLLANMDVEESGSTHLYQIMDEEGDLYERVPLVDLEALNSGARLGRIQGFESFRLRAIEAAERAGQTKLASQFRRIQLEEVAPIEVNGVRHGT